MDHLASRGSWQLLRIAIGSSSTTQSSSSFSNIMCFRFLVSRIQVTNSIGSSISVWQTQYITWSTSLWLTAFVMELVHHRSTSPLTHDHLSRHVGQSSSALGARRALRHEALNLRHKDTFDCHNSWMRSRFSRVKLLFWLCQMVQMSSCRN